MLTPTEMQKIIGQINDIFEKLDNRLKVLEENQKPAAPVKKTAKSS